jgi:hypothetical protein
MSGTPRDPERHAEQSLWRPNGCGEAGAGGPIPRLLGLERPGRGDLAAHRQTLEGVGEDLLDVVDVQLAQVA